MKAGITGTNLMILTEVMKGEKENLTREMSPAMITTGEAEISAEDNFKKDKLKTRLYFTGGFFYKKRITVLFLPHNNNRTKMGGFHKNTRCHTFLVDELQFFKV